MELSTIVGTTHNWDKLIDGAVWTSTVYADGMDGKDDVHWIGFINKSAKTIQYSINRQTDKYSTIGVYVNKGNLYWCNLTRYKSYATVLSTYTTRELARELAFTSKRETYN